MLPPRLFHKIAVAVAFSPRREALLAEAKRFKEWFGADLMVIHIGEKKEHRVSQIEALLITCNIDPEETQVIWEEDEGDTAGQIVAICEANQVDLLIAGALPQEDLINYYLGSVARTMLKKATCSVLVLLEPRKHPKDIKKIVAYDDRSSGFWPFTNLIEYFSYLENIKRIDYFLKNTKLNWFGENISSRFIKKRDGVSAQRWLITRQLERKKLALKEVKPKTNVVVHGALYKPEERVAKFTHRTNADLLIMRAPKLNDTLLFKKLFFNGYEHIFSNLPSNLLILRNK